MTTADLQPSAQADEPEDAFDEARFEAPVDRGWDHLEEIRSTLTDLRSSGSLAKELIQNADDARGSTRVIFRFTDRALVIEDNGGFRKCSNVRSRICELRKTQPRPCDFHAFAELGSATKRNDPTTTGAFGIGFLSVYQVTDRPEILSNGLHWVVDESYKRILPCRHCDRRHIRKGTHVVLPWADKPSWLREKLGGDVVDNEARRALLRYFIATIPACMLFLRRITSIDVFDEHRLVGRFKRIRGDGTITIKGPKLEKEEWILIEASFDDQASTLRGAYPSIIGERKADVAIAVRPGVPTEGRLYATLPTQVATELPLHLNASFFPKRDRNAILLDAGPESEWNRLAIQAAAGKLAATCEALAPRLGAKEFWALVNAASKLETHHSMDARALHPLWEALLERLPTAKVMLTSANEWEVVNRTVLPPRSPKAARLLAELGVPTVSRVIRPDVPAQKLRLRLITLERFVTALELITPADGAAEADLPGLLSDPDQREALRALLAELAAKDQEIESTLAARIRGLSIWEGVDERFYSLDAAWLTDRSTAVAVEPLITEPMIVWPRARALKKLGELGDRYSVSGAVAAFADADPSLYDTKRAIRALRWLQDHLTELSEEDLERLRDVPFIPTATGLGPARKTVRPGGFKDHLGIAGTLDERETEGLPTSLTG